MAPIVAHDSFSSRPRHLGKAFWKAFCDGPWDSVVLMDDRAARTKATNMGLSVTGTIGVLLLARETGTMELAELPAPAVTRGMVLIQTMRSLISAGTERMLVEFSKENLIQKACS